MIKSESLVAHLRGAGVMIVVLGVGYGVLAWGVGGLTSPLALLAPALFIVCGLLILLVSQRFRLLEPRRQPAARAGAIGEHTSGLTNPQPVPDASALPLPWTIRLKPRWQGVLLVITALWLAQVGLFGAAALGWGLNGLVPWLVLLGFTLFTGLVGLLLVVGGAHRLVASEEGLRVLVGPTHSPLLRWEEARLFAIPTGRSKAGPPIQYELSSPASILRWPWVRRGSLSWLNHTPELAWADYDHQMEALLSVIAARTGLPLHDLR